MKRSDQVSHMIQKIRFILISKVQFLITLNSKILQIYAVNRLSFENIYLTKWTVGLNFTRISTSKDYQ